MNRIKDFFYDFIDILLLLAVLLGSAYVVYYNLDHLMDLQGTSEVVTKMVEEKNDKSIRVTIPESTNTKQLAKILKGYHIIEDEESFIKKFNQLNKDAKIKSGEFEIKEGMSDQEIIKKVTR